MSLRMAHAVMVDIPDLAERSSFGRLNRRFAASRRSRETDTWRRRGSSEAPLSRVGRRLEAPAA